MMVDLLELTRCHILDPISEITESQHTHSVEETWRVKGYVPHTHTRDSPSILLNLMLYRKDNPSTIEQCPLSSLSQEQPEKLEGC